MKGPWVNWGLKGVLMTYQRQRVAVVERAKLKKVKPVDETFKQKFGRSASVGGLHIVVAGGGR